MYIVVYIKFMFDLFIVWVFLQSQTPPYPWNLMSCVGRESVIGYIIGYLLPPSIKLTTPRSQSQSNETNACPSYYKCIDETKHINIYKSIIWFNTAISQWNISLLVHKTCTFVSVRFKILCDNYINRLYIYICEMIKGE